MSFASVLTVASCIFIVTMFYVIAENIDYFLEQIEGNLSITVFIEEEVLFDSMITLRERILAMPQVNTVDFTHREDALEGQIEGMEGGEEAFGSLRYNNPLRHSFEITLHNLRYYDEMIVILRETPEIGRVADIGDTAEIMVTVRGVVRFASFVLIAVLALIAVVLIMNTIRITVSSRQVEIGIMKYVGATDWFIRWPFVIEGLLIGFIGGLIPALIGRMGYGWVVGLIDGIAWLNFLDFMPGEEVFALVIPMAVGLGVLIGLAGSAISVRKYLKV